jgi:hypothetical protein
VGPEAAAKVTKPHYCAWVVGLKERHSRLTGPFYCQLGVNDVHLNLLPEFGDSPASTKAGDPKEAAKASRFRYRAEILAPWIEYDRLAL